MAKSTLLISFDDIPNLFDSISFRFATDGGPEITILESWVNVRAGSGQVTLGVDIFNNTINYLSALQADLPGGKFNVTIRPNAVLITAIDDNVVFSNFIGNGEFTETITNEVVADTYRFNAVTFSAATTEDECTHVTVNVVTNLPTTQVTSPVSLAPNSVNFSFEYVRGAIFTLNATNGNDSATQVVSPPKALLTPTVDIVPTPVGATVTVSSNSSELALAYSLDNVVFQSSNVFNNITAGNYTVYVADAYGCTKSVDFVVAVFSNQPVFLNPKFYLSESNPFHFKLVENIDNKNIYKSINNTLACEEKRNRNQVLFPHVQKVISDAVQSFQLQTSYANVSGFVYSDGDIVNFTASKESNNINKTDVRSATMFDIGGSTTGLYFDEFPEWAEEGAYFYEQTLDTSFIIDAVYYDSDLNKDVIEFNRQTAGTPAIPVPVPTTVSATYNRFDWDIFELHTLLNTFEDKEVYVFLEIQDDNFGKKTFVSEKISVRAAHDYTLNIKYKNTDNTDVFFAATGIWFEVTLDFESLRRATESDNENDDIDTTITPISSNKKNKYILKFTRLTTAMESKIQAIFGHDTVYIDNEKYVTASRAKPTPIGNTNLYSLEIELYKIENNIDTDDIKLIFPTKYVIPKLLTYDGNGILVDSVNVALESPLE